MTMMHPNRGRLVATHPMWGTENSGPDAAVHGGFTGRTVVICERERSDDDAAATVETIYRTLGMPVRYMSAEEQDMHCAYVSHISHITSFALALTVLEKEREEEHIFDLAGGGFESTVPSGQEPAADVGSDIPGQQVQPAGRVARAHTPAADTAAHDRARRPRGASRVDAPGKQDKGHTGITHSKTHSNGKIRTRGQAAPHHSGPVQRRDPRADCRDGHATGPLGTC